VIENLLNMGRVNNTFANEIIRDAELSKAFTDITGVTLEGTTEQKRNQIRNTVREYQVRSAENEELAKTAAEQAQTEQAIRDGGYTSYIRGIFAKGANVADAKEILRNPDMKAEWESITGKTLPTNEKSAIKMIQQTKRNPANIGLPDVDAKYSLSDMIDSDGVVLTDEQKQYFGEHGLKDDDGNLLVLYRSADGGRTVWDGRGEGSWAQGIYLTDDVHVARAFASNGRKVRDEDVLSVYAKAEKPFVIDAQGNNYMSIPLPEDAPDWLRDSADIYDELDADHLPISAFEQGYDAVIIKNVREGVGGDPATDVILRDSNQFKRTDNTNPTFDPDIRYSLSEDIDQRSYAEITDEQQKLYQREIDLRERKRVATNNPELLQAMDDYSSLFTNIRELLAKKRAGTATQAELDRIEEAKSLKDEYLKRVSDLQERLGLNAIAEEEREIREAKEALRVAADAAWAREGAEKENKAIEKSGLSAPEYFRKKALKAFKTTANFNEAGYMLPDGKLLNFSGGERNHRYRDHREIGEIYEATQSTAALNRFLKDGNIRIMAESPGIDITAVVEPTQEQYAALRRFIKSHGASEGKFFVDISGADGRIVGKYSYEGRVNADRVLNDIKYFYQNGEVREQSSIGQFLSLSKKGEQLFAPIRSSDIYGKDIRLETAVPETVAPVVNAENATTTEPVEDDIAPVMPMQETAPKVTEKYEAIRPKREKQPKLIKVDTAESEQSGKQRKWVKTSTESEVVDGQILPDDLEQDKIFYQPIPNKVTLNKANARLDNMGYDTAVTYFNSQFANKSVSLEDVALGERLIQEAIRRGDTKTAGELIQNVSILGTELGQKVQALSIIKRLTPEGQLKMLQKTVERGKTKGDKAFEGVEITQEMIDHILKTYGKDGTYDQKKLNQAVEDVKQQIADQMKVTAMDKVNAWRYLSMLGNPKTHIRNLVSNVAMRGTVGVKNAVARTIESIAPIGNRTKTWESASNAVKDFAQKTTAEMKDEISGEGKYSESASIKEKRAIFKNKILNGLYEFNSDMLSKEDWWFSKPAFTNALSEFLTANGVRTEQDIKSNPELVEKAKQYALEQSQIATFRQYSWLANKINDIERKNAATQIAVGAILPFKKTPVNIAKTGLNYSPLGFAKTLTYDMSQVKKGDMEASEMVDHLAQNITGSALALAGYLLASSGLLNGAGDDDKEGDYDYQLGRQAYSVNIGGATYSLSWLSPVAMPLFVGANAYEQLVEGKEWNGNVVIETLAQTLDPLSEMSFISGLDSVLSSYDSGIQKFAGIGETMAQNYASQFVPTLSSQIATVLDDTKRSTKVAGDSNFKFVDKTINSLIYKIPFLRETLEPSTDIWGNEVKQTENILARAFETFLAPYARREDIATGVDEEIKNLYAETGDTGLIPSIPYNNFSYDGEKYKMSAEDYTEFKKNYGQIAVDLMEELFDTDTYMSADSESRADMVNKVYDYARDEARRAYFAKHGVEFTNATSDGVDYYKPNTIKGAIEHDMTPDEYSFFSEYPEKYKFFKNNGISYEDYKNADEDGKRAYTWAYENPGKYKLSKAVTDDFMEFYQYRSDMNAFDAKDTNGKTVSGLKKERVTEYINGLNLDYGQKIILYRSMFDSKEDCANYNYDIIEYLNGRDDISYLEMVSILTELGMRVRPDGTVTW
jgi:hypothetical protein